MNAPRYGPGIEVTAEVTPEFAQILTPDALAFAARLQRAFGARRTELLARRVARQVQFDAGELPDFLAETRAIRDGDWTCDPVPARHRGSPRRDHRSRRPQDDHQCAELRRERVHGGFRGREHAAVDEQRRGAAQPPRRGQAPDRLRIARGQGVPAERAHGDAVRAAARLAPAREARRSSTASRSPARIFDFALYFFHNAKELIARGSGPYFYLPKLESHLEARLWNDVFVMAQDDLCIPRGTIKATVLIETILAAFEMDEILYELRHHSAGLNAGRWDYIFSCIKKFRSNRDFCLADRALVTMTTHFMKSYAELLVKTCHRRDAHAMGGMAAQIPVKNDEAANAEAFAKVKADKEREARQGHDGTWVAHPGLVPVAKEAFDRLMPTPNQIATARREDVRVSAPTCCVSSPSSRSPKRGLRLNINVAIQYIGAWLAGQGAVPIFNLMEDAATAEISRSQVWQWIRSPKGMLDDGRKVTKALVATLLPQEMAKIRALLGAAYADGQVRRGRAHLRRPRRQRHVRRFPDVARVRTPVIDRR